MHVNGMSIPLFAFCQPCTLSKSIRTTSKMQQIRALWIFGKIFMDVIGPITPVGFNGSRWLSVITDDHSRCRWIYDFKQKNEASRVLMNFIQEAKTQYNRDVKIIRLNNGTEYRGAKLLEFLKERGSKLESTVPYTPEQDGVSERSIRTLLERVRSMHFNTGVPKSLWPKLMKGMIHIINRTATRSLDLTPIEQFNNNLNKSSTRLLI